MTDQEIEDIAKPFSSFCVASGSREFDHVGFARALLSRAIPDGHVVVPKEIDWTEAPHFSASTEPEIGYAEGWNDCRKAMIAAAPANKEG